MANTVTGLFETLVVAAGKAVTELKFTNRMLERIWMDPKSHYGVVGQTMNVNVPAVDESKVTDIGTGSLNLTDTDHATVPVVLSKNLSTSYVINDFDSVRTPEDMRSMFMDSRMESLMRKVDRAITALVTTANFPTYASITGGADTFTRDNLALGWQNLVGNGVPVEDSRNFFFTASHVPYSNMLKDTALVNEAIVGINAAESAQQRAVIMPQFGAQLGYDQLMPIPSAGTYAGLLHHRNAIAMVVALSPLAKAPNVRETVVYPKPGMPVRVQLGYDIKAQGWVVAMNLCMGAAVVRPDYGQFFVTT